MTASELNDVLKLIEDNYPRDSIAATKNAIQSWNDALGEFSQDVCFLAARAWVKENHFAPRPSDIRKLALKSGKAKKREEFEPEYFEYYRMECGRAYRYACILAEVKEDVARIRAAGYGGFPILLKGSPSHKELQAETRRIKEARNNVPDSNIHNFRRDDQKS